MAKMSAPRHPFLNHPSSSGLLLLQFTAGTGEVTEIEVGSVTYRATRCPQCGDAKVSVEGTAPGWGTCNVCRYRTVSLEHNYCYACKAYL